MLYTLINHNMDLCNHSYKIKYRYIECRLFIILILTIIKHMEYML